MGGWGGSRGGRLVPVSGSWEVGGWKIDLLALRTKKRWSRALTTR